MKSKWQKQREQAVKREIKRRKRTGRASNSARRRNAPKSRTISLKGFTGKIKQLANGALIVKGKGRKK